MENLIPIINKLQDAFTSAGLTGMDLPQIAVIGSQSSGKSSVLESIVGKDFLPRGSGIVTRRPLVLQLHHHNEKDEYGVFLHNPSRKIYSFNDIRKEIEDETDRTTGQNKGISPIPINLKIYSPNVISLTLIDLPGITKVPVGDQPADIESQIRNMVSQFIEKETCLILAVSPANADIANSDALQMARRYDPDGDRTIGVLTKLDLMDEGTDALDILQNKVFQLKHGFVGVVNRSQKEIDNKKDVSSALRKEQEWFGNHPVYSSIKNQCGTAFLQEKLRKTLLRHIQKHIPPLKARLQQRFNQLQNELTVLNSPYENIQGFAGETIDIAEFTPSKVQNALMNIIRMFGATVKTLIDGHDGDISGDSFDILGLMIGDASVEGEEGNFGMAKLQSAVRIKYLFQNVFPRTLIRIENRLLSGCMDDEIRVIIHNTRGLRAGLFVPDAVFEILVKREIKRLEIPALQCVDTVYDELVTMINLILHGHNSPIRCFPALQTWMLSETQKLLDTFKKPCVEEVCRLIEMEIGYLNTNHPDFVGREGITNFLMAEKERKEKGLDSTVPNIAKKFELKSGQKEGFLIKLGGTRKNWKKRWFVVHNGVLSFYDSVGDKSSKASFSLDGCIVRDLATNKIYPSMEAMGVESPISPTSTIRSTSEDNYGVKDVNLGFEIYNSSNAVLFRNHTNLVLTAENVDEKMEWVQAIHSAIQWAGMESERSHEVRKKKAPPAIPERPRVKIPGNRPPTPNKYDPTLSPLPTDLYAADISGTSSTGAITSDLLDAERLRKEDDTTISLVKMLLHSYFVIIRKHIQDLVPKAIMLMMVTKLKKELPVLLSQQVLDTESNISPVNLLQESDSVKEERSTKMKLCQTVKSALNIIDNEVRFDLNKLE